MIPIVLTIAGSDSSGGAGIQADLRTFTTLGVYGTTAVTCVVAEHPGRVLEITALEPAAVARQIRAVLEAFPIAAIKTGMLHSKETIHAVHRATASVRAQDIPLVADPVMMASAGGRLMRKEGLVTLRKFLRHVTLVTPNRAETSLLLGREIKTEGEVEAAALELARSFGGPAFLVKGGHFRGRQATDVLALPDGTIHRYAARRIAGIDPHGTGCTYSAAITAGLAQGLELPEAVRRGKLFITRTLERRFTAGRFQLLNSLPE